MARNGYFQVSVENGEVFLDILAPIDGGVEVKAAEVGNYLTSKNIECDVVTIDKAIKNGDGRVKLCDGNPILESASMVVSVSEDKMTAYARFYAPFKGGAEMDANDIMSELKFRGVKYGVSQEAVDVLAKKMQYCKTFIIAKGDAVEEGSDAKITYLFNTELDSRPAQNEDGSVDFHNLNNICLVKAGDTLAEMTPANLGKIGTNVLGETIKPKDVKKVKFQYGKNISVSEDGLTLISNVNGQATLVDGRVFVSNVYEVNDVDASTGDIDFDGGVLVRGDVKTGYKVKATGDIDIKGAVENAVVEAGGQIIVARGINGNAKGVLRAGSNVICKYVQNANIYAGGYIETDCVIHSEVVSGSRVCVQGKRGFINGGVVRAKSEIEVKTLGSEMGTDTTVEVGVDPTMRDRYNRLNKEVIELTKSLAQNEPVAIAFAKKMASKQRMSPEQLQQAKELAMLVAKQKETLKSDKEELAQLEIELDTESEAVVRVTGMAYPGSTINISGATLNLKTEYHYCRFKREGADVRMVAL